jgi:heme/copper-type cytochrome/quinol oxidase subunit 1
VIVYFAIAYHLWPHLTGRALADIGLMRAQLWLWFVGIMVTTFPWHWRGILGMPRRMAYFDYTGAGGDLFSRALRFRRLIVLTSGILLFAVLSVARERPARPEPYRFAKAIHAPAGVPAALQRLWPLDRADDRALTPSRSDATRRSLTNARSALSQRASAGPTLPISPANTRARS